MRLLYFTPEPWPTFRPDVAVLIGRLLPRQGIAVDLVTMRHPTSPTVPWEAGDALLAPPTTGRFGSHIARLWHVVRHLMRAGAARYTAVAVRDMPLMATLALLVCAARGLPVVYWMSYPISLGLMQLATARRAEGSIVGWIPTWVRGAVGLWLLRNVVIGGCRMLVVQSERMRDDLATLGADMSRMVVVPMGVDLLRIRALTARTASPPRASGPPMIGYLGTLDRPRRIDVLLDMLADLQRDVPGVRLLLVGDTRDDEHRTAIHARIHALGLDDRVEVTGWLDTCDAWRRILECSVAISTIPRGPLLDVASPTKVPEYLALGVPVVCNDNPDQKDLIEACGAGSCVPLTAADFAGAVRTWLRMDDDERRHRVAAGQAHIATVRDYPQIAAALAESLRRCLAARPAAAGRSADA